MIYEGDKDEKHVSNIHVSPSRVTCLSTKCICAYGYISVTFIQRWNAVNGRDGATSKYMRNCLNVNVKVSSHTLTCHMFAKCDLYQTHHFISDIGLINAEISEYIRRSENKWFLAYKTSYKTVTCTMHCIISVSYWINFFLLLVTVVTVVYTRQLMSVVHLNISHVTILLQQ